MTDFSRKHCVPCEGGIKPYTINEASFFLSKLNKWAMDDAGKIIWKTFFFKNFYETINFVNQVANMAHAEDHHPEMIVNYNNCKISYTTHAILGLSENDFICASKIDEMLVKSKTPMAT